MRFALNIVAWVGALFVLAAASAPSAASPASFAPVQSDPVPVRAFRSFDRRSAGGMPQSAGLALATARTLSGLLPMCSSCRKIRDDRGDWNPIELYVRERSGAQFSDGICPDCMARLCPEFSETSPKPGTAEPEESHHVISK